MRFLRALQIARDSGGIEGSQNRVGPSQHWHVLLKIVAFSHRTWTNPKLGQLFRRRGLPERVGE